MTFFERLLRRQPPEVVACLRELEALRPTFSAVVHGEALLHAVRDLTAARSSRDAVVASIREAGNSPRQVVLFALVELIKRRLATGEYHIYRGVLSLEGAEMRRAFGIAVAELLGSGFADEEGAREQLELLSQIVAAAG